MDVWQYLLMILMGNFLMVNDHLHFISVQLLSRV